MAEAGTKLPAKTREKSSEPTALRTWWPMESLRREVDRLFDDFDRDFWRAPFRRALDIVPSWPSAPAFAVVPDVDIAEKADAYELVAELPGLDEKNIEVKVVDDSLTIKGEKEEEKKEEKKDYVLHERHFGAFERSFRVPEGVDTDKIEAQFRKGVLTVTLPKKPEAQKPTKKIEVKAT
jgi:HSP20 family protein